VSISIYTKASSDYIRNPNSWKNPGIRWGNTMRYTRAKRDWIITQAFELVKAETHSANSSISEVPQ